MNILLTFIWIILGFIAMSFWEAYIEGKYPWAGRQVGWKIKFSKRVTLTAYHFWIYIMFFFWFTVPLAMFGWNLKLFGVIVSAVAVGAVIEDFFWFIVNPFYSLKKFNEKDTYWYAWLKIGKIQIPVSYIVGAVIALLSWYFLWR